MQVALVEILQSRAPFVSGNVPRGMPSSMPNNHVAAIIVQYLGYSAVEGMMAALHGRTYFMVAPQDMQRLILMYTRRIGPYYHCGRTRRYGVRHGRITRTLPDGTKFTDIVVNGDITQSTYKGIVTHYKRGYICRVDNRTPGAVAYYISGIPLGKTCVVAGNYTTIYKTVPGIMVARDFNLQELTLAQRLTIPLVPR